MQFDNFLEQSSNREKKKKDEDEDDIVNQTLTSLDMFTNLKKEIP